MHDTRHAAPATPPPAPDLAFARRIRNRAWMLATDTTARAKASVARTPRRLGGRMLAGLAVLADAAPDRLLRPVRRARLARVSGVLAATEALLAARVEGWEAATPRFRRLAPGPLPIAGLLRARPTPSLTLALPDPNRAAALPGDVAARTVIYTAVFGDDPVPAPVFYDLPGLRRLCLTDRELDVVGWECIRTSPEDGPAEAAARARILPHEMLADAAPGATASLYLAPDCWLVGNVHTLISRWCHAQDLVLWRATAGAGGWQDLTERHLVAGGQREAVLAQARDCEDRGLPRTGDAADCGVIWRRHARAEVQALMQRWWQERRRHPDGLEAVALVAALQGSELRPRLLPAALGPATDNAFTARLPPRRPRRRVPRRSRLPVSFVYAESHATSASTFLRGRQLSELVAERCPDLEVRFTSDLGSVQDEIVILTSGALRSFDAATVRTLARRSAVLVGCWDDARPDPEIMRETDASMTLSHRQTLDFSRLYPDRPAYLVTHHVNRQIRPSTPPMDRARIGYFGLPANTHRLGSLARLVDVVAISTLDVDNAWIAALPDYNAHWIVRRNKRHDGWKPFLKGFLAARCGAVVIVGRDDEDALQYLGDDYPFYVESLDPLKLEYDTAAIVGGFGGPDWRKAQAIMAQVAARSSDAQVVAEFRAMIAELTC